MRREGGAGRRVTVSHAGRSLRVAHFALALVAITVFACGHTTAQLAKRCAAEPPAGSDQLFGGTLKTTVAGNDIGEPRSMRLHTDANGVLTLGFLTQMREDSCLLVASGARITAGDCQDLSEPSTPRIVSVLGGTITFPEADRIMVDFDASVVGVPPQPHVNMHEHFEGKREPPPAQRALGAAPELRMSFAPITGDTQLLDAPFPNQTRVDREGTVDLRGFPEPVFGGSVFAVVKRAKWAVLRNVIHILRDMAAHNGGFSITSGIFFQSTGPLAPIEPTVHEELGDPFVLAPVVQDADGTWRLDLVSDGPGAAPHKTHPIKAQFRGPGGSLAPENALSLLPLQGRPLREQTLYVAFVRKGLAGPPGPAGPGPSVVASPAMVTLMAGPPPGNGATEYAAATSALKNAGVRLDDLAAMTVFRTGSPTAELGTLYAKARGAAFDAPFHFRQADPDFCVYETTATMPVFQSGKPPHQLGEGVITPFIRFVLGNPLIGTVKDDGVIVPGATPQPSTKPARVVLTVPRNRKMPANGWPVAVFVRAGAGLDAQGSPLVDRGRTLPQHQTVDGCLPPQNGGTAIPSNQHCGEGPAREFARAGMVGITVDGPQTGSRLVAGDKDFGALVGGACNIDARTGEDSAMFDVCNPRAIRDNIRQSAIEVALVPSLLDPPMHVTGGGDECHLEGARLDTSRLALMGHSMGATITPLALQLQPRFKTVVLSGANGSYIENILSKQEPFALAQTLEDMLTLDYCLDEFSMLSSLFQWAEEASDPIVYEQALFARSPKPNVLMMQGIGDHYIPSPVANVNSMGLRLDLLGHELDEQWPPACPTNSLKPLEDPPMCWAGGKSTPRYPLLPVVPMLGYVGTGAIASFPPGGVAGNRDGATRGLVQYDRDKACLQDGHEVAYEIAKARWQYRCFLASFARGQAKVWPAPEPNQETVEIDAECPLR